MELKLLLKNQMILFPALNDSQYEHSISLHQDGKAYLQNLSISTDGLQFENGKMFFESELEPISTVELQDMRTNEGIENIDISLLTFYYSIILASFMEKIKQVCDFRVAVDMITRIYVPDLMRCFDTLGEGSGTNEEKISAIMRKTRAFHTIVGIHHITRNGRPDKSFFPLIELLLKGVRANAKVTNRDTEF